MVDASQDNQLHDQLMDTKFEYAWRYFSLHARQRVTMFNFFLLASGALANAFVFLFKDGFQWQGGTVALVGMVVSLISIGLDVRNNALVDLGEKALKRVENEYLYKSEQLVPDQAPPAYAILSRDDYNGEPSFPLKHKFLIRSLEGLVASVFLAAAIYSFWIAFCQIP